MRTTLPQLFLAGAALTATILARAADAPRRSPELLEKWRVAFSEYCATCHGWKGEGDGPASKTLNPPPTNLVTHPPPGGAPAVVRVLNTGVKGTAMTAFNYLSEEERWAIAYFVESLARPRR